MISRRNFCIRAAVLFGGVAAARFVPLLKLGIPVEQIFADDKQDDGVDAQEVEQGGAVWVLRQQKISVADATRRFLAPHKGERKFALGFSADRNLVIRLGNFPMSDAVGGFHYKVNGDLILSPVKEVMLTAGNTYAIEWRWVGQDGKEKGLAVAFTLRLTA